MCEYAEKENILFRFSPHFELLLAISKCVRMTLKNFSLHFCSPDKNINYM